MTLIQHLGLQPLPEALDLWSNIIAMQYPYTSAQMQIAFLPLMSVL